MWYPEDHNEYDHLESFQYQDENASTSQST
jgi:hypothetical protein